MTKFGTSCKFTFTVIVEDISLYITSVMDYWVICLKNTKEMLKRNSFVLHAISSISIFTKATRPMRLIIRVPTLFVGFLKTKQNDIIQSLTD